MEKIQQFYLEVRTQYTNSRRSLGNVLPPRPRLCILPHSIMQVVREREYIAQRQETKK